MGGSGTLQRRGSMARTALHFLRLTVAGWTNRRQLAAIDYLFAENRENRGLWEHLGGRRRLRLTDAQRRLLGRSGKLSGHKGLKHVAIIVTPETILKWYRELVAKKVYGAG